MRRQDFLAEAEKLICNDRAQDHGSYRNNMKNFAAALSLIVGVEVTPYQASLALAALKFVRAIETDKNPDNFLDLCGYAALTGELASDSIRKDKPQEYIQEKNAMEIAKAKDRETHLRNHLGLPTE